MKQKVNMALCPQFLTTKEGILSIFPYLDINSSFIPALKADALIYFPLICKQKQQHKKNSILYACISEKKIQRLTRWGWADTPAFCLRRGHNGGARQRLLQRKDRREEKKKMRDGKNKSGEESRGQRHTVRDGECFFCR